MLLAITDEAFWEWKAKLEAPGYSGAIAQAVAEMRGPEAATTIVPGRKSIGSIAVISLTGFMTHRPTLFSMIFGGTSTEGFAREVVAALNDSSIGGVLMNVDSPGGSVYGLPEAAAAIRGARGGKPLFAIANPMAGSAAYYLAAQADKGGLFSTPSGLAGSVGTLVEHLEESEAFAKAGLKFTLIKYGQNKGEGHPSQPLSEDALSHTQVIVDAFGRQFEADVAKGRGISVETVRADFGQGRVFHAEAAKAAGLVDDIATIDEVVGRLARGRAVSLSPAAGPTPYQRAEMEAAQVRARALTNSPLTRGTDRA